ncbi:MAG: antirepressor [Satyrvirus sp.]|uniref:Antirepressor n=1 Tax=Satyrvirus sp. TaxID=2487771 RepID=A0A3G5AG09_9VIRU|nr:MAG: antirepressor [Satyrvirus sp.]
MSTCTSNTLNTSDDKILSGETFVDFRNNLVKFNGIKIYVIDDGANIWFSAVDVAGILGFKYPTKVVVENISQENKTFFSNIQKFENQKLTDTDANKTGANKIYSNEPDTIYVDEVGLYSLIFSDQITHNKNFLEWITYKVLPVVRKHRAEQNQKKISSVVLNLGTAPITAATATANQNSVATRAIGSTYSYTPYSSPYSSNYSSSTSSLSSSYKILICVYIILIIGIIFFCCYSSANNKQRAMYSSVPNLSFNGGYSNTPTNSSSSSSWSSISIIYIFIIVFYIYLINKR